MQDDAATTADETPDLTQLRQDIEELLLQRFQTRCTLSHYKPLSQRVSTVARIAVTMHENAPVSFIVKHVPLDVYGSDAPRRPEFLEEAAAYELFSSLEPPFQERPDRIGFHPRGLLLLEDLGKALNNEPQPGDLTAPFARLFARLHGSTWGKGQMYDEIRAQFGLEPGEPDGRSDGRENRVRQFKLGTEVLAEWIELLGLASRQAVRDLMSTIQASIATPGPLSAVLHDDLVHGRQCVLRDGRLRIFDFENARYGLALIDVAKALVGKFERHHPSRAMVLSWPGMDRNLAIQYRHELSRAGGPDLDDATWDAALADAMIHVSVCQVGMLRTIIDRSPVQGALLPNLRNLLLRMAAVLDGNPTRLEARRLLALLKSRIV